MSAVIVTEKCEEVSALPGELARLEFRLCRFRLALLFVGKGKLLSAPGILRLSKEDVLEQDRRIPPVDRQVIELEGCLAALLGVEDRLREVLPYDGGLFLAARQ